MYNVILWKDNGDENFHVFKHKPTFDDLYGGDDANPSDGFGHPSDN